MKFYLGFNMKKVSILKYLKANTKFEISFRSTQFTEKYL